MRLLVVEDDETLNAQLIKAFKSQGYAVDAVFNGEDGLFQLQEIDYDAAVVDIGLPKLDGLALLAQLRQQKQTPVLLLTARGNWQDKVIGLNAGADDYLAKPFQMEELSARLKALIRRQAKQPNPILTFGELKIDTNANEVLLNDLPVPLTAYEFQLLEYLIRHQNRVISKTELTEHLYEQDFDRDSNVIEVFVKRLRNKLSPEQADKYIHTIRGKGYKFKYHEAGEY
ncbi:response regulator transcription factor [Glaciecola sp. 1036]|uniref:response regulator transcription factor n=1 Tax=Alteromonadaceae TaxID=72275 RepID=UPI003D0252CD